MKLLQKIKLGVFCLEAWLRFPIHPKTETYNNRVLCISYDRLGDLLLLLPSARRMEAHFRAQGLMFDLLVNEAFVDLVKLLLPQARVVEFSQQKYLNNRHYRLTILKTLREQKYAATINPRICREFLIDDFLTRAASAPRRIGVAPGREAINPRLMRWSDKWYTELFALQKPFDMCGHFKTFAQSVLLRELDAEPRTLFDGVLPDRREGAEAYAVIVPGAVDAWRRWAPEKVAEVLSQGRVFAGLRLKFVGTPNERELYEVIKSKLPPETAARADNLTGQTTLLELAALLRDAEVVFGNETGTIHLAAAVGAKQILCIEGQGHWGRFLPYREQALLQRVTEPKCLTEAMNCANCNWHCSRAKLGNGEAPCIAAITPCAVLAHLDK